jgi:hypothetical protein
MSVLPTTTACSGSFIFSFFLINIMLKKLNQTNKKLLIIFIFFLNFTTLKYRDSISKISNKKHKFLLLCNPKNPDLEMLFLLTSRSWGVVVESSLLVNKNQILLEAPLEESILKNRFDFDYIELCLRCSSLSWFWFYYCLRFLFMGMLDFVSRYYCCLRLVKEA